MYAISRGFVEELKADLRRRVKGAIFCHVVRRRQLSQGSPAITVGSHQCKGAAPNLSIRLRINIEVMNGL